MKLIMILISLCLCCATMVPVAFGAEASGTSSAQTAPIRITRNFKDGAPSGFKVLGVEPDSPQARMGILRGDVILKIDKTDVTQGTPELGKKLEMLTGKEEVIGLRKGMPYKLHKGKLEWTSTEKALHE